MKFKAPNEVSVNITKVIGGLSSMVCLFFLFLPGLSEVSAMKNPKQIFLPTLEDVNFNHQKKDANLTQMIINSLESTDLLLHEIDNVSNKDVQKEKKKQSEKDAKEEKRRKIKKANIKNKENNLQAGIPSFKLVNRTEKSLLKEREGESIETNKTIDRNSNISTNANVTRDTNSNVDKEMKILDSKLNRITQLINKYESMSNRTREERTNEDMENEFKNTLVNMSASITNEKEQKKDKESDNKKYTLYIFDEMDQNSDERSKIIFYQVIVCFAVLINFYMFFTWKLSHKHKKFPIKLLSYIFMLHIFQMMTSFLLQKTNRNLLFEKIGFLIYLILEYFSMFINALYLLTVIITIKIDQGRDLRIAKKITDIGINIIIVIVFILGIIKYYQEFKIKNCFIGSCLVDKVHIIYATISPKYLEVCILFIFLMYYYKDILILDATHRSKIFDLSAYNKIMTYEICYTVVVFLESAARHFKLVYYHSYRFDEYGSIHDYMIIIKTGLLFVFFGLTTKNYEEWVRAFETENEEEDNQALVQKILTDINDYNLK